MSTLLKVAGSSLPRACAASTTGEGQPLGLTPTTPLHSDKTSFPPAVLPTLCLLGQLFLNRNPKSPDAFLDTAPREPDRPGGSELFDGPPFQEVEAEDQTVALRKTQSLYHGPDLSSELMGLGRVLGTRAVAGDVLADARPLRAIACW